MKKYQPIIDLGIDLVKGKCTYSAEEGNEKFRNAILGVMGVEEGGKWTYNDFLKNKYDVFSIITEIIDVRVEEGLKGQLDQFVDFRSVAFGDKNLFVPTTKQLLRVDSIAGGVNAIDRQRIAGKQSYTIPTGWFGVKFYDDLERFLSGRVDLVKLTETVERSFQAKISEDIYNAIVASYTALTAPYQVAGSYEDELMMELVEHVEAANGMPAMMIGTRAAIRKAVPAYQSNEMKNEYNANGYFKMVDGIVVGILPQAHKVGTDEFILDDNVILVVPAGEKIVKVVMEGEALIKEVHNQENYDDSEEYVCRKKYGVAVERHAKYGVYLLS